MPALVRVAAFLTMTILTGLGWAQPSGVIEFSDGAPPPSDQDKAAAAQASARINDLSGHIQTLSSALNATLLLRDTVSQLPPSATSAPSSAQLLTAISQLRTTLNKAVVEDKANGNTVWKVDRPSTQTLIGETVQLVTLVSQESSSAGGTLASAVEFQIGRLSLIFDAMIVEHAVINGWLRNYPYAVLAKQSPIPCQTVNAYSRNIKCLLAAHATAPDTSGWRLTPLPFAVSDYCVSTQYQNFHVDEWSAGYTTLVRRASFNDHVLPGQLEGSIVPKAHSPQMAGGKC